ncbi:MAG: hypothetical protein KI793_00465 [Rivularia sp. (in: Bacteria)]|nr:hypothetical protein [Rivularia sp. MS3]
MPLQIKNELDKANENNQTLNSVYRRLSGDSPSTIPFLVWLLENPDSPLPFAGKIDLYKHDCLHLILEKSFSLDDEAFVVGFTMGNDSQTNWLHIVLFKFVSRKLYPQKFRFNSQHLTIFDLGYLYGRKVKTKNINKIDFQAYQNKSIAEIRKHLGIDIYALQLIGATQHLLTKVCS